ncbi:MAG: hypothetical protein EPO21_12540, partial [Chloroflexota bacterium]
MAVLVSLATITLAVQQHDRADARSLPEAPAPRAASISAEEIIAGPSVVTTEKGPDGSYQYLVDGVPQV